MTPEEIQKINDVMEEWSNSRQFIYWSQTGTNESEADWTC